MTKIIIPMPIGLKEMKDFCICYIGDLVRETNYDFFFLQDLFMNGLYDMDHQLTDEEFTDYVDFFTGVTLEHDW